MQSFPTIIHFTKEFPSTEAKCTAYVSKGHPTGSGGVRVEHIHLLALILWYFVEKTKKEKKLKDADAGIPKWVEVTLYFMISAGIPIIYLCYICTIIWRRKLVPSLRGPLRILAMYFFRIIVVFIFLWLPGVLLLSFACGWECDNVWDADYLIALLFYSSDRFYWNSIDETWCQSTRAPVMRMTFLSNCRKEVGDGEIAEEKVTKD